MRKAMAWLTKWLLKSYLPLLAGQAGAPLTFLTLYGHGAVLEAFFRKQRPLITIVLIIHFICYLIIEVSNEDKKRLEELRRQLDDK